MGRILHYCIVFCVAVVLFGSGEKAAAGLFSAFDDVQKLKEDVKEVKKDAAHAQETIKKQGELIEAQAVHIASLTQEKEEIEGTVTGVKYVLGILLLLSVIAMLYPPMRNLIVGLLIRIVRYKLRRFPK